ncbi:aspartate transaminase aat1 [Trifolium repens]|nr:aspartate transaminase aat1 [Trifolium repens]
MNPINTTPFSMNPITTHRDTAYTYLMRFGVPSVGIMYHLGPNPNTNNPSPVYLLFLASLVCHVVVDTFGDPSLPITKIVFHFTGLVGCEALLWILVPVFWKCRKHLHLSQFSNFQAILCNLFFSYGWNDSFWWSLCTPKCYAMSLCISYAPKILTWIVTIFGFSIMHHVKIAPRVQQSSSNIMHLFFLYPWCYAMSLYISYAPKLLTHIVTTFGFSMMHHVKIAPSIWFVFNFLRLFYMH